MTNAELLELCEKATPGPWHPGCFVDTESACQCRYVLSETCAGSVALVDVNNGLRVGDGGNGSPPIEEARANCTFIAAAREALPRLIAENEKLTEWVRISVMVAEGHAWGGYDGDEFMGIDWTDHLPSGQYDIWQKLAPEIQSRIEPNAPSGMWVDPSPEGHKSLKEQTP